MDKKHQVIVDAQVFGSGQEQHTLKPILDTIQSRYKRLGISDDILGEQTIVTADTGFASESNMAYLHEPNINAYIPDNQFRSRDPKFNEQKAKYGKRHQDKKVRKKMTIPASEFQFDPVNKTCICPAGEQISFRGIRENTEGIQTAYFEGKLLQCRNCEKKHKCMHNPKSADHRKGAGRQVSFRLATDREPTYTDWMTNSSGMNLNNVSWPRRGESHG
nr:transposase [Agaribacter marinus]